MSADGRREIGWPTRISGTTLITWLAIRDLVGVHTSLLRRGPVRDHFTRAEIARVTGFSVQTTGTAMKDLLRKNLVVKRIRSDSREIEYGTP